MTAVIGNTGRITLNVLFAGATVCLMMVDTVNWLVVQPLRGRGMNARAALFNVVEYGVNSLPIVGLISYLIGAIIAMQTAYTLEKYGAGILIADIVAISALRELAPLMAAILITGRNGSAITAEIGTMKVAEEIDALVVMGLNPTKYLVVPKFIGMVLAVPCVTILSMLVMILGGFTVGYGFLHIAPRAYYDATAGALEMMDLFSGMIKSVFFALVICWVGVYRGFQVEGGAEGVGRKTTSSVVTAIFLIIVVDLVWTLLFYLS